MNNTVSFQDYLNVLDKVENDTNREFEIETRTEEYFIDSLNEYNKQFENEFTDLNYLAWLEAEITDYIIFG